MTTPRNGLAEDLNTLTEDAGDMVASTMDATPAQLNMARERLNEAMEKGKELYNNLCEATAKQAKVADEFIRDNPYKAVGIAAGVGVLIGLLISRRK